MDNNSQQRAKVEEPDYKALFEDGPGLKMVLDPALRIVAASNAFLAATMTRIDDIVGRNVFDVFPDNPDAPGSDGTINSSASFNRVLHDGVTDAMIIQRHDIRRPQSQGGAFEERYWSMINSPLLGADGAVTNIICMVDDVTEFMKLKLLGAEKNDAASALQHRVVQMEAELYARSREVAEANMKLKQANAGQASLLEHAHVLIRDPNDCIVSWNTGAEILYGFSKDEAIGRISHDLLKTVFPVSLKALNESLKSTNDWQGELVHTAKDGRKLVVSSHQIMQRSGDGTPIAIIEVNNNVTEQRQAENELRRSKAKVDAILESMTDSVIVSDVEGNFVNVNSAFASFYKFQDKNEAFKRLAEYPDTLDVYTMDGKRAPRGQWAIPRALSGEVQTNAEYTLRRKDTGETWIGSYSFGPIRDSNGAIVGCVVAARDITDAKQAEASLWEREEHLRLFINHAPVAIALFDTQMRYLSASHQWIEDYGLGDKDIIGKSHYDIFPEISDIWKKVHRRCLAGAQERMEEDRFVRTDGSVQWVRWEVVPWRKADGAVGGIIIFTQDVTARKKMQNAMVDVAEQRREFFRRTMRLATSGKLEISEIEDLKAFCGESLGEWTVSATEEYSAAIREIFEVGRRLGLIEQRLHDFMACAGEALSNALKHAGAGEAACYRIGDAIVYVVSDNGPGILSINVPDMAFVHGYSTAGTGGLGYKLLIACADKVYLATGPQGTIVAVVIRLAAR